MEKITANNQTIFQELFTAFPWEESVTANGKRKRLNLPEKNREFLRESLIWKPNSLNE